MFSQNKKFQEECEKLRQNAAKFIDLGSESSSDEGEIDDSALMTKTLSSYAEEEAVDLRKIREILQDVLTSGAVACLICIESIKRHDKIWSCRNCYCMFHLNCIQKWAKDRIHHFSSSEDRKNDSVTWCCPKCRTDYTPAEKPLKYMCFCGKVENPNYDCWNVPHSCGKTCNKKLKPDCSHTCCLLCHPGPCPPCPKTVLISCCCSKSAKVSRRCSDKEWVCDKVCKKLLLCEIHYCDALCHKGVCPPCKKQSEQKCLCKRNTSLRPCYDQEWQCEEVCGKSLDCGNHICEIICHKGNCPDCPNSGPRLCPCGKKSVVLPCTEIIPPCGDTCDKLLECELHRCSQRCHFGPCERCLQIREMKCRCGQREKSVPCCKEFVCEIKCKKRRDCNRHTCNKKCCVGNCPSCELPCGRTLQCGRHKCTSRCHPGPCYPCRVMVEVTCNCGLSKSIIPCGRKESRIRPLCLSNCKRPSVCHHKERDIHKCHLGPCPPCSLFCEKKLNCGHSCLSTCHSAVPTKIETKTKKEGPWDLRNSSKIELVCKPCPPCPILVTVTCLGGHETLDTPCYQSKPTSCGRICGRLLQCGNHKCSFECHSVEDITNFLKPSEKCDTCNETCEKKRKNGCIHSCILPCHPEDCPPCRQHIKLKCHCQINTMYIVCDKWTSEDENKRAELMSCSNRCPQQMSCGHRCVHLCHAGSCSNPINCRKKVVVRCHCRRRKKEMQCSSIPKNFRLECDAECSEYRESLEAINFERTFKKEEEEKKIQEKEYQDYVKKTEGKRKKKKKQLENNQTYDYTTFHVLALSGAIVCVIGIFNYIFFE